MAGGEILVPRGGHLADRFMYGLTGADPATLALAAAATVVGAVPALVVRCGARGTSIRPSFCAVSEASAVCRDHHRPVANRSRHRVSVLRTTSLRSHSATRHNAPITRAGARTFPSPNLRTCSRFPPLAPCARLISLPSGARDRFDLQRAEV